MKHQEIAELCMHLARTGELPPHVEDIMTPELTQRILRKYHRLFLDHECATNPLKFDESARGNVSAEGLEALQEAHGRLSKIWKADFPHGVVPMSVVCQALGIEAPIELAAMRAGFETGWAAATIQRQQQQTEDLGSTEDTQG